MGEIKGKLHHFSQDSYGIWCPACQQGHSFNTKRGGWTWNDDWFKPTIQGSLGLRDKDGNKPYVCHSIITNGKIEFLSDSQHELAGQTVELPDFPKDYIKRTFNKDIASEH